MMLKEFPLMKTLLRAAHNLSADRFYPVNEGEGVVPRERIRPAAALRH